MKYIFLLLILCKSAFGVTITEGIDIKKIENAITLIKYSNTDTYLDFFEKINRIKLSENGWTYTAIWIDKAVIHLDNDVQNYESYLLLAILLHELHHVQLARIHSALNDEEEEIECYKFAANILEQIHGPEWIIKSFRKEDGKHVHKFLNEINNK